MKHKALVIFSFLLFLWPIEPTTSHTFNSIFSFGDSYTDTGNLNVLAKKLTFQVYTDKLPYGETFFHHPSNRCSDGRLIVDFLAEEFGLPLLRPYLAQNGTFRQGANFAVGGATTLEPAFFKQQNITTMAIPLNTSLNFQLQWFEKLKPSLCRTTKDCRKFFHKSLFIVGEFGINDFSIAILGGKTLAEVKSYIIPSLVEVMSKAIERLISEGAWTIVVPGNVPYGCLPVILSLYQSKNETDYDPRTGCLRKYNELSLYQNKLMHKAINQLRLKYQHVRLINAEYYCPITEFIKYPKHFGFIDKPLRVCCGVGGQYNFNIKKGCGVPDVHPCQNPSTYLNWDGVHLTEAAARYITQGWLRGPYADPPILTAINN